MFVMLLLKNKNLFTILVLLFSGIAAAQIQSVSVGVNGLTCSQCSHSVEMSIRKLDFVKDVQMNLDKIEAEIFFIDGYKVDISKIAKSVKDAGFSVRYLKAKIYFNQLSVTNNYCWIYEGKYYQFIKTSTKVLDGLETVTFIGKKFMPGKEYKKWSAALNDTQQKGCESKQFYFISTY
jgi:copper chaperone CopZ